MAKMSVGAVVGENLRGVNLGGWLVLEKWMTPSIFEGLQAGDEYAFCQELGKAEASERLSAHWNSFITEEDFRWMRARNLNAIRIPVGHWIFGDAEPFIGALDRLDWAMEMAKEHGLKVLIDLHGAPGSQNGWDHSGQAGEARWYLEEENIARTVRVVGRLAERYAGHPSLWGIQVLNEPKGQSFPILYEYYKQAYAAVRAHCDAAVKVVFHDAFKAKRTLRMVSSQPGWEGALVDTHLYSCFGWISRHMRAEWHIRKVRLLWGALMRKSGRKLIVGEWSVAFDHNSVKHVDQSRYGAIFARYAKVQLETFGRSEAWFFWSYKTEAEGVGWSMRGGVEAGVFSDRFE